MQFQNALFGAALIVGAATIEANAWERGHMRGVDLYQAAHGGVVVSLVCDPDAVYGTTESAVLIETGESTDLSVEVSFAFVDGTLITAELVHGRFAKATAKPADWENLVAGFRSHHSVMVTIAAATVKVDLGDPVPFSCR